MTIRDEIRLALSATLANDTCSAQCLDEEEDRERVLSEVMHQLDCIKVRHANLENAFNYKLDKDQEKRIKFEYC